MGELYLFYSTDIGLCAPNLGSFLVFRRWILPIADSQYTRKDFNAKYVKKSRGSMHHVPFLGHQV